MSDHLHSRMLLDDGDVVEVMSDTQANVILTTDSNYDFTRLAGLTSTMVGSLHISQRGLLRRIQATGMLS